MNDALGVIVIILILLMQLFLAYIFNYVKERGKNLATKEDLEEVTRIEEEVRIEFSRRLEGLKSNLSFLANQKVSMASEERTAIVRLVDAYAEWDAAVSRFHLRKYSSETVAEYDMTARNAKLGFEIAHSRIELLVADPDIQKAIVLLKGLTGKMQYRVTCCIMECVKTQNKIDAHNKAVKIGITEYDARQVKVWSEEIVGAIREAGEVETKAYPVTLEHRRNLYALLNARLHSLLND